MINDYKLFIQEELYITNHSYPQGFQSEFSQIFPVTVGFLSLYLQLVAWVCQSPTKKG